MIIVRLIGGLGNQMFQYAIGRSLAYRLNTELKLDISYFERNTLRQYHLFPFNIIQNFATLDDLNRVRKSYFVRLKSPIQLLKDTLNREIPIIPITERFVDFDPEILNLPDNVYLNGYWQSEKYFKDIEEIIRNEFRIKIPPDPFNKKIGEQIQYEESVSIHVRRGDYVSDPETNQAHGVCNIEYYQKAVNEIITRVNNPQFYLFSDDPDWAKANITAPAPIVFITQKDWTKSYEDLRLMSLCKHHIIANSSFSWWGAWLAKNEGQIVIAPSKWFTTIKWNYADRLPPDWMIL